MYAILSEWIRHKSTTNNTTTNNNTNNTVKHLISALSLPGWFDVKLRVIKLIEQNCED